MNAVDQILTQALSLEPGERVRVAYELLDSVSPPGASAEGDWLKEIQRRADRILDEGPNGAPWPEVRARLETRLRKIKES